MKTQQLNPIRNSLARVFAAIVFLSIMSGSEVMAWPFGNHHPSYAELRDYISSSSRIRSPAALLADLPLSYRENFSLVAQSMTLARHRPLVTAMNPRIIIHPQLNEELRKFSRTASTGRASIDFRGIQPLTFAFIGGTNSVEIIEFDRKRMIFLPHLLEFGDYARGVRFDHQPSLFSCSACHTANMEATRHNPHAFRPNWFTYPVWLGLYGTHHHAAPSAREIELLGRLKTIAANHELLKYLPLDSHDVRSLADLNSGLSDAFAVLNILRINELGMMTDADYCEDIFEHADKFSEPGSESKPIFLDVKAKIELYHESTRFLSEPLDHGMHSSFDATNIDRIAGFLSFAKEVGGAFYDLRHDFSMIPVNITGEAIPAFTSPGSHIEYILRNIYRATKRQACHVARPSITGLGKSPPGD